MRRGALGWLGPNLRRVLNRRALLRWWLRARAAQARLRLRSLATAFDASRRGAARCERTTAAPREPACFSIRERNPIHWPRASDPRAAALGRADLLPPNLRADVVVRARDPLRLRRFHHVLDVQAFHANAIRRAEELASLAAAGVVVYVADGDERLRAMLGPELYRAMTVDPSGFDASRRELHSIAMRRAALREHSSWARAAPPTVSVLLATRRGAMLATAIRAVAQQTYPRLELVVALHGAARWAAEAERRLASLRFPAKLVRVPRSASLGAALNAAAADADGALLAKMDDDDGYGPDHVWDLVLAREYAGAALVGKGVEHVYLGGSDRTVHRYAGRGEAYRSSCLAGGTLLISQADLAEVGGRRTLWLREDVALVNDVLRAGGNVYQTHGAGFILVRHGQGHAWPAAEDRFLAGVDQIIAGWAPALAGLPANAELALPAGAAARPAATAANDRERA